VRLFDFQARGGDVAEAVFRPRLTGPGQLPNPALDRVELGEVPRPAAGHFPDQLVHRQRRGMKLQNLAKDRCLLAIVFVMGSGRGTIARALRVVVHGS
jgi:hypothetical protein